jgi:hypothetical protein
MTIVPPRRALGYRYATAARIDQSGLSPAGQTALFPATPFYPNHLLPACDLIFLQFGLNCKLRKSSNTD